MQVRGLGAEFRRRRWVGQQVAEPTVEGEKAANYTVNLNYDITADAATDDAVGLPTARLLVQLPTASSGADTGRSDVALEPMSEPEGLPAATPASTVEPRPGPA